MAVRIWVYASIMAFIFGISVYCLTPVNYLIMNMMNSTAQNSIEEPSTLTVANNVMTLFSYEWAWIVGLGIMAILLWAFLRPTHREWESYEV